MQCGKYIIPVLIPEFEEEEEDITDNDKTGWMGPVTSGVFMCRVYACNRDYDHSRQRSVLL